MQKDSTFFNLFFWLIVRMISWLLIGCLSCIIVSVLIVIRQGETAGITQLQNLLQQNYDWLTLTVSSNEITTIKHLQSGIPDLLDSINFSIPLINQTIQQDSLDFLVPIVNAILLGTKLLIIRLGFLFNWSPLLIALGFVGFVDGITQRYIRRQSAGRESALIYHHAKAFILFGLILGIFASLEFQIAIRYSQCVFTIAALGTALAIQITTKSFKKYA